MYNLHFHGSTYARVIHLQGGLHFDSAIGIVKNAISNGLSGALLSFVLRAKYQKFVHRSDIFETIFLTRFYWLVKSFQWETKLITRDYDENDFVELGWISRNCEFQGILAILFVADEKTSSSNKNFNEIFNYNSYGRIIPKLFLHYQKNDPWYYAKFNDIIKNLNY